MVKVPGSAGLVLRCIIVLVATALLSLPGAGVSRAAALKLGDRYEAMREALETYLFVLGQRAPGLLEPLLRLEQSTSLPVCGGRREPVTHAVLIGVSVPGGRNGERWKALPGSENDTEMLDALLRDRGADASRVHRIAGHDATREAIAAAMRKVLVAVGCEDRVIVSFSGHAAPAASTTRALLRDGRDLVSESTWKRFFEGENLAQNLAAVEKLAQQMDEQSAEAWSLLSPLMNDEIVFLAYGPETRNYAVFLGRDISDFMTAVRNKGAHAVALLDAGNAAVARLEQRQRRSGVQWSYQYNPRGLNASERTGLLAGHGSYTILYAANAIETTPEMPLPKGSADARKYGLFSFVVASELLENRFATPRSIATAIQKYYAANARTRPTPIVESSEPDLVLIAEASPPRADPIRIISPSQQRGAAQIDKARIEIEGLVEWSAPVLGVFVDEADATLEADGRFRHVLTLKSGLNVVNVRAVTADNRLHQRRLELLYEGDRKALEGDGRRYAVIIANQNYGDATGMPSLSTPFADADALAAILTGTYGFDTALTLPDGRELSLIMKDPGKRDIEVALHQLGKVAGARDTVLIFYAGHGVYEEVTSNAYWVPRDAERGFEPSYLSAADISAAIQRIQAGKVILISDSCYAGALMRAGDAGPAEPIDKDRRLEGLLKLQASRSRILITSGNQQPVSDTGGSGHSVFARALLTGLERMEHDAFTARELFDGFILTPVVENSDQEPQFRPLEKVGHEGGDFVFVKVQSAAAAP